MRWLNSQAVAGDGLPFSSLVAGIAWQLKGAKVVALICTVFMVAYYSGSVGAAKEDAELELLTRSWKLRNLAPNF